jgi:hypothetical protein
MRIRKPVLSRTPASLAQGTVIAGFDYETSNVAKIKMDTLAVVNLNNLPTVSTYQTVKKVKTVGTLELR